MFDKKYYNSGKAAFRSGKYCRSVWVGKRTVKAGECAAVWSLGGKLRIHEGPARIRLWFSTVRFLDRFVADQFQYLRVRHRDGTVTHFPGPAAIFKDPYNHEGVEVCDGVRLGENHVVAVYSRVAPGMPVKSSASAKGPADKAEVARRRIVHGPGVFFPDSCEWTAEHNWDAPKGGDEAAASPPKMQRSGSAAGGAPQKFSAISLARRTSKFEITVRSGPCTEAVVALVMSWRVADVEAALDNGESPEKAAQLAAAADVEAWAAQFPNSAAAHRAAPDLARCRLSEAFPSLIARATSMGVEIESVSCQAVEPAEWEKQALMRAQSTKVEDDAVAEKMERAAKLQAEQARDRKAQAEEEAVRMKEEAEREAAAEEARMERESRSRATAAAEAEEAQQRLEQREERLRAVNAEEKKQKQQREFSELEKLHELGVDLTKLLIAKAEGSKPAKAPAAKKEGASD